MNYAVIGTGYWGSNHARVAAELVDEGILESVVLCDVDESRVKQLAESYGAEYTTKFADLPSMGIDAATIATPSPTHHEITTHLLQGGVDCLVEKPLAMNSADAWDIVETADKSEQTLAVGHIFRHHPALNELKARIDRGELGEIKYTNTTRFSFRSPRSSAGVLYSLAVHDVDISNWIMGERPQTVYCNLDMFVREGVDETASIVLDYGNATSVLSESWQVPVYGKRRDIVVVGTEKSAYIDYLEDNIVEIYDSRVTQGEGGLEARSEGKQVYETEPREPLKAEVAQFIEACQTGVSPKATGKVGAEAVELLELSRISSEEGRIVSVK